MKKLRNALLFLMCFILITGMISCGNKTKDTDSNNVKKVLHLATTAFEGSLDPQKSVDPAIVTISNYMGERLLKYGKDFKIEPMLLKELPNISEDGKTYSCELKSNVKFHNGEILKSSDVKFTFERLLLPSTVSPFVDIANMIKGADEILTGKTTLLEGFKIINDTKFEISLKEPYAPFMDKLANYNLLIYSENAVKAAGDKWGIDTFIGTGPFKLQKIDSGKEIILEKFKDYREARKIDEVDFKVIPDSNSQLLEFEKGNIDYVFITEGRVYDTYSQNEKYKNMIYSMSFPDLDMIFLNCADSILKDVRIRKAISLSIDRDKLADVYKKGTAKAAKSYLPPGVLGYDENAPKLEYNITKAKQLLAEAGYPKGLEIDMWLPYQPDVHVAIQSMLAEAGIKLNLKIVDPATFEDCRVKGTIPMFSGAWGGGSFDPEYFFFLLYKENSKIFSVNYNNSEFDNLYDQSRVEVNVGEREKICSRMNEKIVNEDFPVIPIYHRTYYYMVNPAVKGIKVEAGEVNLSDVDIIR